MNARQQIMAALLAAGALPASARDHARAELEAPPTYDTPLHIHADRLRRAEEKRKRRQNRRRGHM